MPGSNQSAPFYGHLTLAQFKACIAVLNDPNAGEGDKEVARIALQTAKQVQDIQLQSIQNITNIFLNTLSNLTY